MRARALATVRVWKKRPEHQAHSRSDIRGGCGLPVTTRTEDRKSTRLNSSHLVISYVVYCLKKKSRRLRHRDSLCSTATAVPQDHPRTTSCCIPQQSPRVVVVPT